MKIYAVIAGLFAAFTSLAADVNITNVTRADSIPSGSYALGTTGLVTRLLPINLMSVDHAASADSVTSTGTLSVAVAWFTNLNIVNPFDASAGTNYYATNLNNGGSSVGQVLTATATGVGWGTGGASGGSGPNYTTSLQTVTVFDDCLGEDGGGSIGVGPLGLAYKANSGGVGVFAASMLQDAPGVYYLQTGSSATALPTIYAGGNICLTNGAVYTNEFRVRWEDLPTVAEGFTNVIGFTKSASGTAAISHGVFFGYDTNDTHFLCCSISNNVATFVTNTTAIQVDKWYKCRIVLSNTTHAFFSVDGTDTVVISTNIPADNVNSYLEPTCSIRKSAGTTARYMYLDYVYLGYRLAITR